MQVVQSLGWFLFLGGVILLVARSVNALIVATWRAAHDEAKELDGSEALAAFSSELGAVVDIVLRRKTGAASAVAVFVLVLATGVDAFGSAGFAAMTFVIVGYGVPALQRRIRPIASSTSSAQAEVVRQEPTFRD